MSSAIDGSSTTCSVRALVNDTIWTSLVSGLDITPLKSYCGSSARTLAIPVVRSTRSSRLALASTDDSRKRLLPSAVNPMGAVPRASSESTSRNTSHSSALAPGRRPTRFMPPSGRGCRPARTRISPSATKPTMPGFLRIISSSPVSVSRW
jgi:hypothetical protein